MENTIEAGREELEHLEEAVDSHLKTLITVLILLVTMLATLAGVLSAIWSGDEAGAQRDRQQQTAAAVAGRQQADARYGAVADAVDQRTEVLTRYLFLLRALDRTSGRTHQTFAGEALVTRGQAAAALRPIPPAARQDFTRWQADLYLDSTGAQERANAASLAADGWLAKHNGALAVVGGLAVALFLLGLSLTIGYQQVRVGFVSLAALGLLVAGGRVAVLAAQRIDAPTGRCIDGYLDALRASQDHRTDDARHTLLDVTARCGHYSVAWRLLGDVDLELGTRAGAVDAAAAYRHAIDSDSTLSATGYHDLGAAQLLAGRYGPAAASMRRALAVDADNIDAPFGLAELAAVSGDRAASVRLLDAAAAKVAGVGAYTARTAFGDVREDGVRLAERGVRGPVVDALFRTARELEARLGSVGSTRLGDAHGARIDDIVARPAAGELGRNGFATIGYRYQGLRAGDHLSVRVYLDATAYQIAASRPDIPVDAGDPTDGAVAPDVDYVRALAPGHYTVEFYVNGVEVAVAPLVMPG